MKTNATNIDLSSLAWTTSYDISLKPFCKEHLIELANNLRGEEWREMWACYRLPVEKALPLCVKKSLECWTAVFDGKVIAVTGIEPLTILGNKACVWSWTSKEIVHYQKSFWRLSHFVLNQFLRRYPTLYAACDKRYQMANKYLQRLGASPTGESFYLAGKETQFILYQWTLKSSL